MAEHIRVYTPSDKVHDYVGERLTFEEKHGRLSIYQAPEVFTMTTRPVEYAPVAMFEPGRWASVENTSFAVYPVENGAE